MKTDMELVRHILLGLEKDGGLLGRFSPAATEHCLLLWEAGLIEQGVNLESSPRNSGMMGWRTAKITPRGIDALAALRDDENLRLVQQHADALGEHASFSHLKAFLQQVADWGAPTEAPPSQP
ncbi:MAG: hypothetical protein ACOYMV_01770 [Verrucomicrobiia bacterium]